MMPTQPWSASGVAANDVNVPGTLPSTPDTDVPEFADRFSISRPILYVRANLGGTGVDQPQSPSTIPQYSTQLFAPYVRGDPTPSDPKNDFVGDFVFRDLPASDPRATDFKTWEDYLRNPAVPFTPPSAPANRPTARRKDSYLLLSAGPDNTFGTKDDIFYGQ
jgi:hypothetical protein